MQTTTRSFRDLLPASAGIVLLLLVSPCFAQQDYSARIDSYIKAEMVRQQIPGVSVAVIRNGNSDLIRSYGFSNLEHQVPAKPETIFQSGSMGKQFTATAVMLLVEDGKLSLDDKIGKYFSGTPDSWKNITVRHLLTHTSGMGDYPADFDLRRDHTEDEYLAIIKAVPLAYETGTRWDYSNLGYVTLGILIHKVTGKFYGDFLVERVFQPLGMTTAQVISEADIVPNRAAGYRLVAGKLKNQEWVSPSTNSTADGSFYFTILDLAKWAAALQTDMPLKQSSLAQMWTPVQLADGTRKAYGFGWHTDKIHNRRIVYHGGAWQGFKSFIVGFPDDKLTLVFFANSWETRDFKFARGLIAIFYPEFSLPAAQPIEDKEPQVTGTVRRVLLQLAKGTADPDLFTADARAKLFPDQARQFGKSLDSLSLPIAIIYTNELIERREENGLRIYRYALHDVGTSLFCTVKLTKDNKIADIQVVGFVGVYSKRSPFTCSQPNVEQDALILEAVENKYLVRRVEFIGNTKTSDNVLRRKILLQEGDVFTRKKLVKSLESVTKLRKIIYPVKLSDVIIRLDHAGKSIDMEICFKERPGLQKKVSRS